MDSTVYLIRVGTCVSRPDILRSAHRLCKRSAIAERMSEIRWRCYRIRYTRPFFVGRTQIEFHHTSTTTTIFSMKEYSSSLLLKYIKFVKLLYREDGGVRVWSVIFEDAFYARDVCVWINSTLCSTFLTNKHRCVTISLI